MAVSWRTALIKKTKKKANSCVQEVDQVLKYFPGLRPELQKFTYNNGIQKELFTLEGTIPVNFRGVIYNIPVVVWLQENHPEVPPLVYVRPTSSMAIKESEFVDTNGRVYHPYLHKWNNKTSDITSFLRILCTLFGSSPPVYSKPPETRSQSLTQQQPQPSGDLTRTAQQQPPPTSDPPKTAQQPQEQQKECIICMDNPRNSVLIPCGHLGCMNLEVTTRAEMTSLANQESEAQ
ncbi:hypothetical protein ACROYT_G040377 [Oculina patagonica]